MVNTRYTIKNNLPEYKDAQSKLNCANIYLDTTGNTSETTYNKQFLNNECKENLPSRECDSFGNKTSSTKDEFGKMYYNTLDIKKGNVLNMHYNNNDFDQEYVFVTPST
mgnify:FL=1